MNRSVSLKTREKMSESQKKIGNKPPSFNELDAITQELVRAKLASYPSPRIGKVHTEEAKKKMSEAKMGDKSPNWKGGVSLSRNYGRFQKKRYLDRKYQAIGRHSHKDWEKMKEEYGYMCLCCKKQEPLIKLTEDHIVPLSRGGRDDISNIQPLCMSCNSTKHTKIISFINFAGVRKG